MRTTTQIVIEIDTARLGGYTNSHLATLWHVAQANPAPLDDRTAGELAERVGRQIIRRWLKAVEPELWHHQGEHFYWSQLRKLGKWNAAGEFVPNEVPDAASGDAS